jgi:L-amino acid N-acyltransferase YncA
LLAELVERATARGMRQMVAIIGDSAHAASIQLHQRAGFRLVGTLEHVGWKLGRWLDTVIMQRPLGPGSSTPAPH